MSLPVENISSQWPASITLVRHAKSAYNAQREILHNEKLYRAFSSAYDKNPLSFQSYILARLVDITHPTKRADFSTPLAPNAGEKAQEMASILKTQIPMPDVVFVSPLIRTQQTFDWMLKGWPELDKAIQEGDVKVVRDARIREQEFGDANAYINPKVYFALNRRQAKIRKNMGELADYWHRIPGGESKSDVQQRQQLWIGALNRNYSGKNVLAITHHLSILAFRAAAERLNDKEYMTYNREHRPINLGVTIYESDQPKGKLICRRYNGNLLQSK